MEFNKSVSNPMLMGCIQLVKEEDSKEHRNMFVEELVKSVLQAPAAIVPPPVVSENGKLDIVHGSRIQFPMLSTKDGKKFYMGFTDPLEYKKWVDVNSDMPSFALTFQDYATMLFGNGTPGTESPANGIIINPMGVNIVVPKEMVASIVAAQMGYRPILKNVQEPDEE